MEATSWSRFGWAALCCVLGASSAVAQRTTPDGGDKEIELPSDPRLWHNSAPLSLGGLEGKGVVFYFFEEECGQCAAKWPQLQRGASNYQGQPVLFIGVNSGTDPRGIRRYLAQHRVRWPVIHDADRSLEQSMGLQPISLNGERSAVKYVTADGSIRDGDRGDFAATVESALEGATWKVEPGTVPEKLRNAWWSIEIGDYPSAARAVSRGVDSGDDELAGSANRLLDEVKQALLEDADEVRDALAGGDAWDAYKRLDRLVDRYDGYGLTEQAEQKLKTLGESVDVKDQLDARELLGKALSTASKGTPGARRRAAGLLRRIVDDHAGTEAAERATRLLASGS